MQTMRTVWSILKALLRLLHNLNVLLLIVGDYCCSSFSFVFRTGHQIGEDQAGEAHIAYEVKYSKEQEVVEVFLVEPTLGIIMFERYYNFGDA